MIALFRFAYSPFDDSDISFDEMAAFASDHVQRMSGNDPNGDLAPLVAATMPILNTFHDALDSDQSKLGIRKGSKLVKDNFRKSIVKEVEKLVASVIAQFGSDSAQVLQVVPQGRKIFSDARDDRIQDHLETLVTGITALEADLGAAVTAQATDVRDQWTAIYTASEESTGVKQGTEAEKHAAKDGLAWQLYQNLVAIADLYPRDPDKLRAYMQQSLLGIPEPTGLGDGPGGGGTPGDGSSDSSDSSDSSGSSSSDGGPGPSSSSSSSSSGSSGSSSSSGSSGSSGSSV